MNIDATTGLPIAHSSAYYTPDIREQLSAALMEEKDITQLAELDAGIYLAAKTELDRLREEVKKTNRLDRDRLDMDTENLVWFVRDITEARVHKIVGLAASEAIIRSSMDRSGMTDNEKIMMNKMVDAIRVYLDETYKTAGVTA